MSELEKPMTIHTRKLIVLGTDHRLQGKNFQKSIDDPCYREIVEQLIPVHNLDFIFEEAAGFGPTHAEGLALSHLGPNRYLDVDPPRDERAKHGLSADTGEDFFVDLWQLPPCVARTEYVDKHAAREKFWLTGIFSQNFTSALMVCGYPHCLSFAVRLRDAGFHVEKCAIYLPHDKLCGHVTIATGG